MSQTQAAHADSIDGQDPHDEVQKKVKSRRPASTTTPSCYSGCLSDSPEADIGLPLNRYCFPATEIEGMAVSAPSQSRVSTVSRHALTISRPILTPKTVLPLFFIIGIIFAPIGGLLLYASAQVSIHYTRSNSQSDIDLGIRCKNLSLTTQNVLQTPQKATTLAIS